MSCFNSVVLKLGFTEETPGEFDKRTDVWSHSNAFGFNWFVVQLGQQGILKALQVIFLSGAKSENHKKLTQGYRSSVQRSWFCWAQAQLRPVREYLCLYWLKSSKDTFISGLKGWFWRNKQRLGNMVLCLTAIQSWEKRERRSLGQICPLSKAIAAAKSLQSCLTLCNPRDGSPQAPQSLGFSRQEH